MRALGTFLPVLALGGAAILMIPGQESAGYTTIGGRLAAESQRDFRVYENFADPQANNNMVPDDQFPGWFGAEMAIWKAAVEWGSLAHGDGGGDPLQPVLGDGNANFDYFWSGSARGISSRDSNVVSALSSCGGGGVLAFTETPIGNGWRIRFCDEWVWHDGPGDNPGGGNNFDLQGVGCHELGHALGLGHSSNGAATMYASTSPPGSSNQRSIHPDDQAGVQFIYGAADAGKPVISSVSVDGDQVTITGMNFSPTDGEVWFTNSFATGTNADPRVRLLGVSSTMEETRIVVTAPAEAGDGDVAVKKSAAGHRSLSNAYPIDLDDAGPSGPLTITGVVPSTIDNLIPGTAETITIAGTGFDDSVDIFVDGTAIAGTRTVVDDTTITFEWEAIALLGLLTLEISNDFESDTTTIQVVANSLPALQVGNGDPGNVVSDQVVYEMGGQGGDVHYVLASTSPVPSLLPGKIDLALGDDFRDLHPVGLHVIPSSGVASGVAITAPELSNITLYWQTLRIRRPLHENWPLQSSNLQSTYRP